MKKNKLRLSQIIIATLLICLMQETSFTQNSKVSIQKLTDETQKTDNEASKFTLVWWIPEEFWKYTFEQDPSISNEVSEQIIECFRPYTLVLVADGLIGTFGGINYKSEETLRKDIRIIDNEGNKYYPIDEDNINPDAKSFLTLMEPLFTNMLGNMGKNMNFFAFPAKSISGKKIADPYSKGSFTLKFDERDFSWRLPLGSLIPMKKCPVDAEEMNGAWIYCPWHGTQLK